MGGYAVELRHLRYFLALAAELSFTRAAEKVHVTQSTLSHQIKQLEEEIGQPLFSRVGKRVVITEAGEMLLSGVSKALREIDDGVRAIRGAGGPVRGTLQIGSTHTFNIKFIPPSLALFLQRHPGVAVTVLELSATEVEVQMLDGTIDLGITYRPPRSSDFIFEPLYIDEMMLAVAADHPWAGRKRVRLAELHRHPLVVQTRGSDTRQILDSNFRSVGAEPAIVAEMNAAAPMISLVQDSKVGAIVSKYVAQDLPKVRFIALESPTPLRTAGLLQRVGGPGRGLAARCFISVIRQVVLDAGIPLPRGGGHTFPMVPAPPETETDHAEQV